MSSDNTHSVPVPAAPPRDFHYKYTVQKGVFLQSEDSTDDTTFDFKKQNFGLIDRSYPTDSDQDSKEKIWPRFEHYARSLASSVTDGASFKVLFLGRHGQGWHNVAESKYGTHAWDCYYSALDGHDGLVWADAHLTPVGEQQAQDVNALWAEKLTQGLPPPETYYVSPLTRTIQTADLSFRGLNLPAGKDYTPYIVELLREALGVHTCDRRSTKTALERAFPHLNFERGFSENDALWEADYREPRRARKYRLATFLDRVFAQDENVFLSLTSHSGAIASILEAVGHRPFALETGGVIPVFLRAERVEGSREVPPKEPSETPPMCDGPSAVEGHQASI
ncbi:phosphoglycerate mutase family protein [Didymella exigua CBS 183.55]|uniref:Phosphoglycerate mutase family protein n=1 Tax=Didymella exigua CBS 183.55 TaxID=1150837 RepID=A0A6A5RVU9_9PLEO|nr:phosphoglycerate mutase family protein [Didymella exigua CBS 183.55]KAF1931284.1 phosphoglycerate mutase family protein [Didymella exigua CBS 183.55]